MDIGFEFSSKEVKQGSIVPALIKIDAASAQEFPIQKLKLKTFADTIYVYDVGTPIRKEGRPYFEADAKIIFIKVPENNELNFLEDGKTFKVFWNPISVVPTEKGKQFVYGAFDVPARFKALKWFLVVFGALVLSVFGFFLNRQYKIKSKRKKALADIKRKMFAATTYPDVVELWMSRQLYLNTFPAIEEAFRDLEQKLFKIQFKPSQSEDEKRDAIEAYKEFLNSIKGKFDGI